MTIPTDPYNSPQRRPFDEGHILKPLYEEKPKAADFGHSAAKEPDAKGRADASEGAAANERPEAGEGSGERRGSGGSAASGNGGSAPSGIVFTRATQVPSEPDLDDTRPRTLATPLFRAAPETPSAWNAASASTASPATTSIPHPTAASPAAAAPSAETTPLAAAASSAAAYPSAGSPEPPQAESPHRPATEGTAPNPSVTPAESASPSQSAASSPSAAPIENATQAKSAEPAESPTEPTPPMPSDFLPSTAPTPSITPEDPEETAPAALRPSAPRPPSSASRRGEPGDSPAAMRESLAAAAGLGSFSSSRTPDQQLGPTDSPAASRPSPTRRSRSQTPAYSQSPGHSGAGRRSPAHSLSVQSAVVSAASPSENRHPIRTSLRRALADVDADGIPTTGGVSSIFSDDVATTTFETSRDIGGTYESATSFAGASTFGEGSTFGTDSAFDVEAVGDSLSSEVFPASSPSRASEEADADDSEQTSPAPSRRRTNAKSQRAALDDSLESDVPAAPKKRAPAHIGVLFATIFLVPPAWYVVSDAHARLVAAYKDSSVNFAGAGELVGGLAILALIWFLARASSLGAAFTGWIVAAFGALGLALPHWTERSILDPISQRLAGNGFTRNVATLLAYDMLTGLMFVFGGVLILTGAVSHWARRRGHKYGVLIARRTLALESLQEYENVYVPTSRARRAEPTDTNDT
mgnify:CR=1 FL=1